MRSPEQQVATSVLVIGTGGSGLRAAIELSERGIDVLAVGKRPKGDAHTTLAAGGINAALATMDPEDSWQQHAADTLTESYLLADPVTVQVVTEGAAESIKDLERYGMAFSRQRDGRISQRYFGPHTFRRTAFAGDYTGLELQRTLVDRAARLAIPTMDSMYITKILVRDNVVFGAYGFDLQDGTRYTIHADAVILATGGHTRIWRRTSARRDENTGDSFRLAVEAGGRIRDPELVQFHPCGLIEPEDSREHWCLRPPEARAASCATPSANGSCNATTPSGWSYRPATASHVVPTPKSRKAAAHREAGCGSTCRTCREHGSWNASPASIRP